MGSFTDVLLQYVCPTMGSIMASVMFAAPVRDLRNALVDGKLGALNPFPWSFLAGNCLGWVVYGYYTRDPFVLAANLPGLILSIWLNSGAAKLQYLALRDAQKRRRQQQDREHWDASSPLEDDGVVPAGGADGPLLSETERFDQEEAFVMVPQERALLRVLTAWAVVIVYVGWFSRSNPATIVGLVVNLNLVVFYGAPLQTMQEVIATSNSESIHVPTMAMNWTNTSFWIGYGIARKDAVIIVPNCLGLCLGLMQGALKAMYPSRPNVEQLATIEEEPDTLLPPEEELPESLDDTPLNRRSVR